MADKKLTIFFSGISTLSPTHPRDRNERQPTTAFVLMAAKREQGDVGGVTVDEHVPFVFVPKSVLAESSPEPSDRATHEKYGACNIYYLKNTRVTIDPAPSNALEYFVDWDRDLDERPGSDDVAPENDIRWLADLHDLLPGGVTFKSKPEAPGSELAAIIELSHGRIQSSFPCKSVQPMTFRDSKGEVIPGTPKRVLASEFKIDMTFDEKLSTVTLQFKPLRRNEQVDFDKLVLNWPENGELAIHIGNDTTWEAKLAGSSKRCDARDPQGNLRLQTREDDFSLHYELLNLAGGTERPLPHRSPHQTSGDGCKGAKG